MREKPKKITQFLANYPLTFYCGLLVVFVVGLLLWLRWQYSWQINVRQFWLWASHNAEVLLLIISFLLGSTLIASGIAYRKTCRMSQEDYYLWLQQRSTRTLFPLFTPLHDWLRLRFSLYRWWHSQVYATTLNLVLLILIVTISVTGVRGIVSPFPGGAGCSGGGGEEGFIVEDTIITSDTVWATNQCHTGVFIYNNAKLTIEGGVSVQATSITLGNTGNGTNGHIIFKGDTLNNTGVLITTGSMTAYAGSTITGNGRGYVGGSSGAGSGLGGGGSAGGLGGGGAYGGTGGSAGGASGGVTYGSASAPDHLGSGGGFGASTGGHGGAAIKFDVAGTFTHNGSIEANGSNSLSGGGGSGGTVWIKAHSFSGTGSVTANGGNGGGGSGGGGGGRIVRQYTAAIGTGLTLSATAGSGGTGAQAGTIQNIGPVQSLAVSGAADSTVAGTSFSLTVTAKDAFGTTHPSYSGTINFTSTDPQAVLPTAYAFVPSDNGVKTFTGIVLKTAGPQTISVTETENAAVVGSKVLTVTAASVVSATLSGISQPVVAGSSLNPTITVRDVFGNTATTYTGVVSFSSTDPTATLPPAYTFTAGDQGAKTFAGSLVFRRAGIHQLTYTMTSSPIGAPGGKGVAPSIASNIEIIQVEPAAVAILELTWPSISVAAGQRLTPTLKVRDAYGNIVTSYRGTVRFRSSDPQAVLPSNYTFTASNNGSVTLGNSVTLKTAGAQTVTVSTIPSGNDPAPIATTSFSVAAGPLASLKVSSTSPQKIGVGWTETVSLLDEFGNPLSSVAEGETAVLSLVGPANFFTDQTYARQLTTLGTGRFQTLYLKAYAPGTVTITVRRSETGLTDSAAREVVGVSGPIEILSATDSSSTGRKTNGLDQPEAGRENLGLIGRIQETTTAAVESLRANPQAIGALNVAAATVTPLAAAAAFGPVTTAVVTAVVDTMVKGASFFGGQIGLLPMRLRGRRWGRVRNRRSGLPIGGVFVQLLDERGHVVERVMTDRTGHYAFLVEEAGRYWIEVTNPLYERFMSRPLTISDPVEDIINEDIELALVQDKAERRTALLAILLKVMHVLTLLHWPLLVLGSALALYVYTADPTLGKSLIVSLYVFLWASKLLELNYHRPYGVVVDSKTGLPQPMSVVQIVSAGQSGAPLVRSTVTDARGRFLFVVRPGRYTLTVGKEGYEPFEMDVQGETADLTIKLKHRDG